MFRENFEVFHEIAIEAKPSVILQALNTKEGLEGWWTEFVVNFYEGNLFEVEFSDRDHVYRFAIRKADTRAVEWWCFGGHWEWDQTGCDWTIIEEKEKNHTIVKLQHYNWKEQWGNMGMSNTIWSQAFVKLKEYCEGKEPGPFHCPQDWW